MHPNNIHTSSYDFKALLKISPELSDYVLTDKSGHMTIDFSVNKGVVALNRALLKFHYGVKDWQIPDNYLCPPIPGRADYIHHLADLLTKDSAEESIVGLDIGVGANCIYPILGAQIYGWQMVGADIEITAVNAALKNISFTPQLQNKISIRHQSNNAHIFEGIIKEGEYYHFSMCNPPFHASRKEAQKGTLRKLGNLHHTKELSLNFGGQAKELWCNGGEALFIKRMIKESSKFKNQVGWFTTLVSKKENLPKIYKQLEKMKVNHTTVPMEQGNKQSRFVAWKF
ncbi:23S rRNA (adenine(1618)-N(6))-methyltransferase RlmF [Sediminicola sp. 1XM1-17]|uniref:23S rRNA (adenine(1618)-N(6))-methyltransferase RlmF n=1 Tax=Sediminicola sp. 1XM1-17 TaxID=3127702 RepID=UPI0030782EAF